MRKIPVLLLAWILFSATFTGAETVRPDMEIGSRVFASYLYDFSWYDSNADSRSSRNGMNLFELDRAELYLYGWASKNFSAEVRTEARRVESLVYQNADGETERVYPQNWGEFQVILKHAYVHAHLFPVLNFRAGMIPLPWIGREEQAWKYRFVEETLEERSGFAWHEADIGLELFGKIMIPTGNVSYSGGVVNGEGYRLPEENIYKAGFFTIHLAPLMAYGAAKGLTAAGGIRYEVEGNSPGVDYDARLTASGILNYDLAEVFGIGAEALYEKHVTEDDGSGADSLAVSAFGSVRLADKFWLLARCDYTDWNLAQDPGKTSRRLSRVTDEALASNEDAEVLILAGAAYEASRYLRVALSFRTRFWEQSYPEGPRAGERIQPEMIGKASLEFGF